MVLPDCRYESSADAFQDKSTGTAKWWKWDFGDGATSTEQNLIHQYQEGKDDTVGLEIDSPRGHARREKIWEVAEK